MSAFTVDAAGALPGSDARRAERVAAAERLTGMALPSEAEEVWRYSRISTLDLGAFAPLSPDGAPGVPDAVGPALAATGERAGLLVLRDGRVVHAEVDDDAGRRGVALTHGDGDGTAGRVADSGTDYFTEMNTAFAPVAVHVSVPAGVVVERPIVVVHFLEADGAAVFPRTIVELGEDAEATLVEYHASADVAAFVDPVVELAVADAARLRYLNVQRLGHRVWQTAYQASEVGRDGSLLSATVALGGDYARVRTDSRLAGRGAGAKLLAVYFGAGTQMHDFRTMQDHAAPTTASDLLFKGAVQDRARSVYSGLIRVRKQAAGTNAFQTNRNLVLSEGASAESVPNLEIEINDVQCSHASAVGPVDEEQRYYLESRGVPPDVAERLIVMGFFAEVLERLPVPALAATLHGAIAAKFAERAS